MIVRPKVLQTHEYTSSDGTLRKLYAGRYLAPQEATGELISRERKGLLQLITPYDFEKENPDAYKRIVYTGRNVEAMTEAGLLYRMIPKDVDEKQTQIIKNTLGDDTYTFLNFCDIHGVYISHNTTITDFDKIIKPELPATGANVLFIRDEGAGDIILSMPTVREIKRRLPYSFITYATLPQNFCLLRGQAGVDKVMSIHDLDLTVSGGWDLVINTCRAIENYSIERNRRHRIDSFSYHIGLGELEDKNVSIHFSQEEKDWAFRQVGYVPCIAYVAQAAYWNRTWSLHKAPELFERLYDVFPDFKVIYLDRQPAFFDAPNMIDLGGKTETITQAAAVTELCKLTITNDTGLAHCCGALGNKTLVLIGSVPPEARFSTYDNFRWIHKSDEVDCCPCWDFQARWTLNEKGDVGLGRGEYKNCSYTKENKCLEAISVDEIVANVKEMLK